MPRVGGLICLLSLHATPTPATKTVTRNNCHRGCVMLSLFIVLTTSMDPAAHIVSHPVHAVTATRSPLLALSPVSKYTLLSPQE